MISDRFGDSTTAYQGFGRGLDAEQIDRMADWVQGSLEPDLTLLLDAPAEIGLERTAGRDGNDRMDNEALEFYQRVREGYLTLARVHADRFRVIDADRPLDAVQADLQACLEALFDKN